MNFRNLMKNAEKNTEILSVEQTHIELHGYHSNIKTYGHLRTFARKFSTRKIFFI